MPSSFNVVGTSTALAIVAPSPNLNACACVDIFTQTASGGVKITGSANVQGGRQSLAGSGGVMLGGSALVSCPTQPFDTFAEVWHLDGIYNGTPKEVIDSAPAHLNGQSGDGKHSGWSTTQVAGLFSYAQDFDQDDFITAPNDNLSVATPLTVSLWASPASTYNYPYRVLFSRGNTDTGKHEGWQVKLAYTQSLVLQGSVQVQAGNKWLTYLVTGTHPMNVNCWYHCALVWTPGTSLSIYLDATLEATTSVSQSNLVPQTTGSTIGMWLLGGEMYGRMQEVRVSPTARSQSWLQSEVWNLCDPAFMTIGAEQHN